MSKVGAPEKLIVNGKRLDGRKLDEFRKIEIDVPVLNNAGGSATFSFGDTRALAAVYGPKNMFPRWMQDPLKATLRCKYSMIAFSTKERVRPGHSRRSTEISKVITEALNQVIFFHDFPKTSIDIFIDILQADASTRCAGLNAASLALAAAGVPMKDLIASCSVGKADGKIVLDVFGKEDNYGDVDIAVACIGNTDKFVLLQMDGVMSKDELFKALRLSNEGCRHVYELQKKILREKYKTTEIEGDL